MKRLTTLSVALATACILSVATFSAIASASVLELPQLSVLSGASFPVTAEGSTKKQSEGAVLESTAGKLPAEELKATLTMTTLSALGEINLDFAGVTEGKSKEACKTEGAAEGTVLAKGEFHLVPATNGELGLLILFKQEPVLCSKGLLEVLIAGPWLTRIAKGEAAEDFESLDVASRCEGVGKQELTSYFNDEEKEVTSVLMTDNFGGVGPEFACEEVKEELPLKFDKMVSLNKSGSISLLSTPWLVKQSAPSIFFAKNLGSRSAPSVSVSFTSKAFQELSGPANECDGKTVLQVLETCEVKLQCIGTVGAEGPIEVTSRSWFVANGTGQMRCVL